MKDKILYLVLGILIGAVITAGCFLVFSKSNDGATMVRGGGGDMQNMVRPDNANFDSNTVFKGEAPSDASQTTTDSSSENL